MSIIIYERVFECLYQFRVLSHALLCAVVQPNEARMKFPKKKLLERIHLHHRTDSGKRWIDNVRRLLLQHSTSRIHFESNSIVAADKYYINNCGWSRRLSLSSFIFVVFYLVLWWYTSSQQQTAEPSEPIKSSLRLLADVFWRRFFILTLISLSVLFSACSFETVCLGVGVFIFDLIFLLKHYEGRVSVTTEVISWCEILLSDLILIDRNRKLWIHNKSNEFQLHRG